MLLVLMPLVLMPLVLMPLVLMSLIADASYTDVSRYAASLMPLVDPSLLLVSVKQFARYRSWTSEMVFAYKLSLPNCIHQIAFAI